METDLTLIGGIERGPRNPSHEMLMGPAGPSKRTSMRLRALPIRLVDKANTVAGVDLRTYAHLMSRAPGDRERLKALVDGERIIATGAPAGPPSYLGCSDYEPSILRVLAQRRGEDFAGIRAAVADDLEGSLGEFDRATLPSGRTAMGSAPRQGGVEPRAGRRSQVGSRRGVWKLAGKPPPSRS